MVFGTLIYSFPDPAVDNVVDLDISIDPEEIAGFFRPEGQQQEVPRLHPLFRRKQLVLIMIDVSSKASAAYFKCVKEAILDFARANMRASNDEYPLQIRLEVLPIAEKCQPPITWETQHQFEREIDQLQLSITQENLCLGVLGEPIAKMKTKWDNVAQVRAVLIVN